MRPPSSCSNFGESRSPEFQAQAYNVFNHAQYVPGSINNVANLNFSTLSTAYHTASNSAFRQAGQFLQGQTYHAALTLASNLEPQAHEPALPDRTRVPEE